MMAAVLSRDTAPELAVRKIAHALGYRFRLHPFNLPGTPDIVFPRYRVALFVHGCFWHSHPRCPRATIPKTRIDFCRNKLEANRTRDARASAALRRAGWKVAIIWGCQTGDRVWIEARL